MSNINLVKVRISELIHVYNNRGDVSCVKTSSGAFRLIIQIDENHQLYINTVRHVDDLMVGHGIIAWSTYCVDGGLGSTSSGLCDFAALLFVLSLNHNK